MRREQPAEVAPRSEQRDATRLALMEAGVAAFAEKGHDGVNLAKDILEPVGISVGSFYHQFANKTDLLVSILTLTRELGDAQQAAARPRAGVAMRATDVAAEWTFLFDLVDGRPEAVTMQLREAHSPHAEIAAAIQGLNDAQHRALVDRYEQMSGPETTVDAEAMADMTSALGVGALTAYLRTPPKDRPRRKAELVERLTIMTMAGISGFIHDQEAVEANDDH